MDRKTVTTIIVLTTVLSGFILAVGIASADPANVTGYVQLFDEGHPNGTPIVGAIISYEDLINGEIQETVTSDWGTYELYGFTLPVAEHGDRDEQWDHSRETVVVANNPGTPTFHFATNNREEYIDIFNILGQRVTRITSVGQQIGRQWVHSQYWDGYSESGVPVVQGMYFMKTGDKKVKKFLLDPATKSTHAPLTGEVLQRIIPQHPDYRESADNSGSGTTSINTTITTGGIPPAVDEIDETTHTFLVTIRPDPDRLQFPVRTFTRELTEGDNGPFADSVFALANHRDISGALADMYTQDALTNTVVQIRNTAGNIIISETATNNNGEYEFTDIPAGEYQIHVDNGNDYWKEALPSR